MREIVRLVDQKLENPEYLGLVASKMWKKPWQLRDSLKRKMHDGTMMQLWEAVNKVEGKQYTLYELFIEKHTITKKQETWKA